MLLVMSAVNIPAQEITIIFAIDWALYVFECSLGSFELFSLRICVFSDRIRTSVNILGDGIGAGVVDHLVRDELGPMELEEGKTSGSTIKARTASEISTERRTHAREDLHESSKL